MRKIALVGTASSGVAAPYYDKSWEIWGVSSRASYVTRADRWYELHRLDGEPPDWAARWRVEMKKMMSDVPVVYMMYPEPELGLNIKQYPYEQISARFGTYFMTSTFSWMMAQAIDELRPFAATPVPGEIAIYGVDMEYGTEYRQQRVGFRHFMDLAKYAGIPVTRLADSGLAYEPVPYPMWQDDPLLSKISLRSASVKKRLADRNDTIRITQQMIAGQRAVITLLEELESKPVDLKDRLARADKMLRDLISTSADISKDIVSLESADAEQQWMSDYLQP